MHTNLLLPNLIRQVLQEIRGIGLCLELNCQYRRTYDRLKEFAEKRNTDSYSAGLIRKFLDEIKRKYVTGAIGRNRRNHLRRASLLLKDYVENGQFEWKTYRDSTPQMPSTKDFLFLYSRFIDDIESRG